MGNVEKCGQLVRVFQGFFGFEEIYHLVFHIYACGKCGKRVWKNNIFFRSFYSFQALLGVFCYFTAYLNSAVFFKVFVRINYEVFLHSATSLVIGGLFSSRRSHFFGFLSYFESITAKNSLKLAALAPIRTVGLI